MIKYFLFSPTQMKFRKEIEAKMGRKFIVGHVIVNGIRKPFTDLSATKNSIYSDSTVVAELDTEAAIKPKYEMPRGE